MRRLPIYFLIDVSESMVGEPIEQVEEGMANIIKALKKDPIALETVWISIIAFAGESKAVVPLQDIISFYPPKIPIGSGTFLGKGLRHLMSSMDAEIVKTTYEKKGDWKPIIFLFTDGVPTDNPAPEIKTWNEKYANKATLVIITLGENHNYKLLTTLSKHVLQFDNRNPQSYKEFFQWITASIQAASKVIDKEINLSESEHKPKSLSSIDLNKKQHFIDNNFVVLHGRCSHFQMDYLLKYQKQISKQSFMDLDTQYYKAIGGYKIDGGAYTALSNVNQKNNSISSEELIGNLNCPCCGAAYSVCICACGGIHCIDEQEVNQCPWCGVVGTYGVSEGDFDINRTLG